MKLTTSFYPDKTEYWIDIYKNWNENIFEILFHKLLIRVFSTTNLFFIQYPLKITCQVLFKSFTGSREVSENFQRLDYQKATLLRNSRML